MNFASAFALQPKSIFALITDLGLDFFTPELAETVFDLFPKTAQTSDEMGDTYFAKSVLGRQGEGCFSMISGKVGVQSSNQDLGTPIKIMSIKNCSIFQPLKSLEDQ